MDNATVIPTKSMMRIFIPIWNQVTELLTVASGDLEPDGSNLTALLLHPLVTMSEDILRCLQDLSMVCQQTVAIEYPSDSVAKKEVDFCSQNLLIAGESLVLASHILCSAEKSEILIKTPVPHQMDVCGCLSDLYQCMVLLLLAIDDAEVRKIINFGLETTKALTSLVTASSLQGLNDHFRSLGKPAANFYKFAVMRCNDIEDRKLRNDLRCDIVTFRQSLPMLTASLQMAIKYPDNSKLLTGRNFCVEQVHRSILEINKKIALKQVRCKFYGEDCGSFHENWMKIKDLLSTEKIEKLDLLGLRAVLQNFVQKTIELTLFLSKSDVPMKTVANHLVACCRKIMKAFRELEKAHCNPKHPNGDDEISKKRINLIAVSEAAMLAITDTVSSIIVWTFTPMHEPLVQLVDACMKSDIVIADAKKDISQRLLVEDVVTDLSEKFLKHAENIENMTKFAASCCKNAEIHQKYKKSVKSFQDLSKAVVAATSDLHSRPEPSKHGQDDDLVRNDQILDLQERWVSSLDDIVHLVVFSLDLKILLETIIRMGTDTIEKCVEGIVNLDREKISKNLHLATGQSTFLVKVGLSIVSTSIVPVYRNGILSHAKTLKNATTSSIAFGNQVLEDLGETEQQELFMNTIKNLLECMEAVSKSILSTDNHPELTSISRCNVRAADVSHNSQSKMLHTEGIRESRLEMEESTQQSSSPGVIKDMTYRNFVGFPLHESTSWRNLPIVNPLNPIVDSLLSSLNDAIQGQNTFNKLEDAKALFSQACELAQRIASNTLLQSPVDTSLDQQRLALKRSLDVVESLKDIILKDVERLSKLKSAGSDSQTETRNEIEALHVLASQWSGAAAKIANGCMALLPVHIVPIRRYCVYFIDALTDQQKDVVTKSLVPYPGYRKILIENVSSLTNSQDWDDVSSSDFKVHEKNTGELIRLIEAISDMIYSEMETEKREEASAICVTICEDWQTLCDIKQDIMSLIKKISSKPHELVDKVLLQLQCLAWSSKIYALHINSFNAARLILLEFDLRVEDFSLIPLILEANSPETSEIIRYKETISSLVEYFNSYHLRKESPVAAWTDNLTLTKEVIEEILDYLSSVRSSVPLIYHHGHSMFHAIHLHHLFYIMLAYLTLARKKERRQPTEFDDRPSLSARLKSLKELRERQDESLSDLLQTVPKLDS